LVDLVASFFGVALPDSIEFEEEIKLQLNL